MAKSTIERKGFCRKLDSAIGSLASFCYDILISLEGDSMAGKEGFHGGHFSKCIALQAIFWYLRYSLSYRDIEELMKERGVEIDHATVQRWVVKYTPLLEIELWKIFRSIEHQTPGKGNLKCLKPDC